MSKYICIDFDGVIHRYDSKWVGPTVISDPPVDGALQFIRDLIDEGCRVGIFSTRNEAPGGVQAMQNWLGINRLEKVYLDKIEFPSGKPTVASLFIDDRAFHFEGIFPTVDFCKSFKPWNKQ